VIVNKINCCICDDKKEKIKTEKEKKRAEEKEKKLLLELGKIRKEIEQLEGKK
jgi:hypothetical protein